MELNLTLVVILGLVEGLTEFVPISSTGHLILFGALFGFHGEDAASFDIFIQIGAILAVVFYYPNRFKRFAQLFTQPKKWLNTDEFSFLPLGISMIPVIVCGLLMYDTIKEKLFSPFTVGIGLVVGGVLMVVAEKFLVQKAPIDDLDRVGWKRALGAGFAQCLSLWPGMSRSGSTILGGLFFGMSYSVAAEFSFIVAVPVMSMAIGYDLLKTFDTIPTHQFGYFLLGGLISFVVAFFSIKFFLGILKKFKLVPFGWYRIIIGLIVIFLTRS